MALAGCPKFFLHHSNYKVNSLYVRLRGEFFSFMQGFWTFYDNFWCFFGLHHKMSGTSTESFSMHGYC